MRRQNQIGAALAITSSIIWSGNFIVGKFATLYEVPPLTLNFFRWLIVWIILIPFTVKDILINIKIINFNEIININFINKIFNVF